MSRAWWGLKLSGAALLVAAPATAQHQTLRQVLEQYQVPAPPPRVFSDLDRAITSHATLSAPDLFVIAYYRRSPDPRGLDDSLHVAAFERAAGTWAHRALERGVKGSVLAIRHSSRHVFLDTHINPSAGSLVVLSRGLEPVAELDGWSLRLLPGGAVIYHRSQVHFAPTHPAELWIWNAVTGREAVLYPAEPFGVVRRRYTDSTRARYARLGEDWLREHNYNPDPSQFGSRLGDLLVTDQAGTAAAFVVRFGEDSGLPADPPPLDVLVTCRGITFPAPACSEVELAAAQGRHPGWSVLQLLNDLMGNPPRPELTGERGAVTLERMTGARVRFRVRPGDAWRYGMLSMTRVPVGCFSVMLFGPDRTLRSQVWLDSVATLEASELNQEPRFEDWIDTARPRETWMPIPGDVMRAAVTRCRDRRR